MTNDDIDLLTEARYRDEVVIKTHRNEVSAAYLDACGLVTYRRARQRGSAIRGFVTITAAGLVHLVERDHSGQGGVDPHAQDTDRGLTRIADIAAASLQRLGEG